MSVRRFTFGSVAPLLGIYALVSTGAAQSQSRRADLPVASSSAISAISLEVPATAFVLKNGLTVVVHEDHSSPIVAVHVLYHVGSKDELAGRTGFAHLFEHLMFNGSENFNDDFFKATQRLGASDQNGTTSADSTNYYQTVPKASLDSILWLESDRMGHLLGAIDQAKLDEQRSVVKNEKRESYDNAPYGQTDELIVRRTIPKGHPYDHLEIGSMEDLDAAKLEDVREWFRTWYGPSNAVLVLAGDITPADAKAKVEKYFGDIAPGAVLARPESMVVRRSGTIRETLRDRVAQPRLLRVWNVSEQASPDITYLQILGDLLAGDKNARLYKRLVLDEQLATGLAAGISTRELGSQFMIDVIVKPGGDLDRVERIVDEELTRLIDRDPTRAEIARVQTARVAGFVRSLESISSKAALLANSQAFLGSPDAWKASWARLRAAAPSDVRKVAKTWLTDGDYVLRVSPLGDLAALGPGADRKSVPKPGSFEPAAFPAVEHATLTNGMKLIVAPRSGVPVINFSLLVDTGTPTDFDSINPDTGKLAMDMMDEGTMSRSREQLVEQLGTLGARLRTGGGAETGTITLSALKPALKPSLTLFSDVIMHPAFATADIDRLKSKMRATLASIKDGASSIAGRILPRLMHGAKSPYGRITTDASIEALDRSQVLRFYERWFHPNNSTLIVTGDTNLAEIRPLVEASFLGWNPAAVPKTIAPHSSEAQTARVFLVDRPGSTQSAVRAAFLAPPRRVGDEVARQAFNAAFGGSFISRLNMKIREEKGWAYGAGSVFFGGRGSRVFYAAASVQTDRTAESMAELAALLKSVTSNRKVDAAELASAKDYMALGLSNDWSTSQGIMQYLVDQVSDHLPDDHFARYPQAVSAQTVETVNAAAIDLVANQPVTWVVVGDRSKIEQKIRALNFGELMIIDSDGNPVR